MSKIESCGPSPGLDVKSVDGLRRATVPKPYVT